MWRSQTGHPKRPGQQTRRLELFAMRRPAICIEYGLSHVPHTAGRKSNKYWGIVISRTSTPAANAKEQEHYIPDNNDNYESHDTDAGEYRHIFSD
jgi:hypothetical protein